MDITFGHVDYGDHTEPVGIDLAAYDRPGLRIGIFGSSGAGKGWLLGLTLEQCVAAHIPVIAIDPESELWTLQEIGALVLGGPHADAPIPANAPGVRAVMEFAIETGTPVVFDLGDVGQDNPADVLREGERLMGQFNRLTGSLRQRVVFAVTEAELFAPQQVPRTGTQPQMLAAIQKRGRKRGVIPILETQRTADIAKSVISQCNLRFVGHLDEPLDYDNVKRHIAPWTFVQMRALPTGHFVMTPEVVEIVVGPRTVTHGGATPLSGEVRLARRDTSAELAVMLERLRADQPPIEDEDNDWANAPLGRPDPRVTREMAEFMRERDVLRGTVADLENAVDNARDAEARALDEIQRLRPAAQVIDALRAALIPVIGENLVANTHMPDGMTMASNGLTEDEVVRLIRQNTTATGTVVEPVEALRTRYLEAAAQRLYETVRSLSDDEREAMLFILAHTSATTGVTINAVSVGITGSDAGSMRQRWTRAVGALMSKGLVRGHGSGATQRKENIDAWLRSALAPHDPTDSDLDRVRARVLSLLATSSP